eukprot:6467098-Amphidinium_carterae.1
MDAMIASSSYDGNNGQTNKGANEQCTILVVVRYYIACHGNSSATKGHRGIQNGSSRKNKRTTQHTKEHPFGCFQACLGVAHGLVAAHRQFHLAEVCLFTRESSKPCQLSKETSQGTETMPEESLFQRPPLSEWKSIGSLCTLRRQSSNPPT